MAIGKFNDIGIIGAGIGGLFLALSLHQQGISCVIYEAKPQNIPSYKGPLTLYPNGVRASDSVEGVLGALLKRGALSRYGISMGNNNEKLDVREIGNSDKYGYDAMRIYRQDVADALRELVDERGIPIKHGMRYVRIAEETELNVTVEFQNGQTCTHQLVVGVDGIHSKVRAYLNPEAKTNFTGILAVCASVPRSTVKLPFPDYPIPCAISGAPGKKFVLTPPRSTDEEYPFATTCFMEDLGKEGWEALGKDKPRLLSILRDGYDDWNPMVQGMLDAVTEDKLYIWPFYAAPKMERWASNHGRVLILGDSAHGIPPAGGFGANMAFEDVSSLVPILAATNNGLSTSWTESLKWWQETRNQRLDDIIEHVPKIGKRRGGDGTGITDETWLYNFDVEKHVQEWIAGQ